MSTRRDYATPARRAFCRHTAPSTRYGVGLAAVLVLTGLSANSKATCVDALEFKLGVHAASLSAPDYTTPNPLGIIEYRRECGSWVVALSHTSSLQGFPAVFDSPGEDGYGINQLSVGYRFAW